MSLHRKWFIERVDGDLSLIKSSNSIRRDVRKTSSITLVT